MSLDVFEVRGFLYLIRGLPGSGKTTLGKTLRKANKSKMFLLSADDYFTDAFGKYKFFPEQIAEAHEDCIRRARNHMSYGHHVIVANTFSQRWEMQPYIHEALRQDYSLTVIDLFDAGQDDFHLATRCRKHGVPQSVIEAMRARWEHDWRNGSPIRPEAR